MKLFNSCVECDPLGWHLLSDIDLITLLTDLVICLTRSILIGVFELGNVPSNLLCLLKNLFKYFVMDSKSLRGKINPK